MKRMILGMIITLALQGCSTIYYGKFQDININTTPAGATARVGTQSCVTPCKLTIYRKGADDIYISQANNIEKKYPLNKSTNILTYWVANLFTGFFPGRIVDNVTGAEYTIADVNIALMDDSPNLGQLSVGMAKAEVLKIMRRTPYRVSAYGNTEYLIYEVLRRDYFIRLIDGKVDAYGRVGDFDSTKDPRFNLHSKQSE